MRGIVYGWVRSLLRCAASAIRDDSQHVRHPSFEAMAKRPTANLKLEEGYSWAQ